MPKVSAAGDWLARPFDPKCKERVPVDADAIWQIGDLVLNWTPGDWPAVKAVLVVRRPELVPALHTLSPRDIGQICLQLSATGVPQVNTAVSSVTVCNIAPAGLPFVPSDVYADIVRRLERKPRIVLKHMHAYNAFQAVDKLTRQDIADGTGLTLDNVAEALDKIRAEGRAASLDLLESGKGHTGGLWLTPAGKLLAERVKDADKASKPLSLNRGSIGAQ